MNNFSGLASFLLLTACAPAEAQAPVHGTAQAKDGDSLMVGDKEGGLRQRVSEFISG